MNTTTENTKRALPVIRVTRRIYSEHKVYGTCITLAASVYCAPPGACTLTKKDAVKAEFTVQGAGEEAVVLDTNGKRWFYVGENGGCGPRCPESVRASLGKIWHGLSFAERKEILARLAAPKIAVEIPAAPAQVMDEGEPSELDGE